ncbi:endomucin isoform X3 [Vombatus ursinus]|uniref:endomucin isoform X3 n=1 Tax=Vombatus ursinus TaxID=29139 RepID=UPI000FFD2034|nr:endomucin isoform X3 [Vombatus ursinus]
MKLLHGTFLFLSMCSLCYSQGSQVPTNITTTTMYFSSAISTSSSPSNVKNETVQTTVDTPGKLNTSVVTESVTTSPVRSLTSKSMPFTNTGTLKEPSSTPMISTKSSSSLTVATTEKESPQTESPTEVSSTAKPQGSDHRFQSTASTTESSQKSKNTLGMTTTPYIKDQGSSKGVILPVVIALIAITLSVFTLVGLYRMCWKTDPGTPDNGTDQPQSDKESVKLLTVKTISPETSMKKHIAVCGKSFS